MKNKSIQEQKIENDIRNGEFEEKCYQCGKVGKMQEYTIRQNFANRKIMCCSDLCAQHAQMGAED